jgi:hypothetical protein
MKIAYFPDQTALQSEKIWFPFLDGCEKLGLTSVKESLDADCAVIWSMLWWGKMKQNQEIYEHYRKQGKPVFVIEVGALDRGRTWKIAVNDIRASGIYANDTDLDINRPKKLGIELSMIDRKPKILIACQHPYSHQWQGLPSLTDWLDTTIKEIKKITDLPIVVRPHPRYSVRRVWTSDITVDIPNKIPDTYDKFDIDFGYQAVINHNSGPGIQAALAGVPVVCDQSSLAFPVSVPLSSIMDPTIPDRKDWLVKISHTEWTVDEIAQGIPQERLLKRLTLT